MCAFCLLSVTGAKALLVKIQPAHVTEHEEIKPVPNYKLTSTTIYGAVRYFACYQKRKVINTSQLQTLKPVPAVGINPGATASGPVVCPSHTTVTHIQRD